MTMGFIEKLRQELAGATSSADGQPFHLEVDDIKLTVDIECGPDDRVSFKVLGSLSVPRPDRRVTEGLSALYTFEGGRGNVISDVSSIGAALDLTVNDPTKVEWLSGGGLAVRGDVLIASAGAATKVIDASKGSEELTIEAWIKPATTTQSGPARIVTLSRDPYLRNFTLGQGLWDKQPTDVYDVRFRTTTTDANGRPSTTSASGTVRAALTQVVFTRAADGTVTIYLDGESVRTGKAGGTLANWDASYRLALANELADRRPWHGEYRLVAVYHRALSAAEIRRNFVTSRGQWK